MSQHFDVAVIGTQASGLITAALLAKRGRRVLLVDHGENITTYKRRGYKMPLVPTLVPTLEDSPPIRAVHEELGLGPELRGKLGAPEASFQAVMPGCRIDVRATPDNLLEELGQEFPELVEPTREFFHKLFLLDARITEFLSRTPPLPPAGLFEKWRAKKLTGELAYLGKPFEKDELLAGIPEDHPLRDMLLGPLSFFGHLATGAPSTFHAARLIARYYRGVLSFTDRLTTVHAIFQKAAEDAGVVVRHGAVVRGVHVEGRRVTELELEDERKVFSADFFIDNALSPFEELLPAGKAQSRFALEHQAIRPVGSLLVLNLLVKSEVIPRGMAEAVFLLNGRRRAREEEVADPPLFVQRYPATKGEGPRSVDAAHEILSVACPVKTADVTRSPQRFAAIKAQMLARVGRLVPFLEDFLVDTSAAAEVNTWDGEPEVMARKVDPWSFHPIYEPSEPPFLGIASRKNRGYLKNLVHCGRDIVPGLGLEGEYVAALGAVNTLKRMAGKRWSNRP